MADMSISEFDRDLLEKLRRKSRLFGSKMALLAGSYARAAGLQSEISKVTVTRVAGSEVQYQRCLNSYRKDLCVNISSINHEQRKMRKTLHKYSEAKRHNRREREKRNRAELTSKKVKTLIIIRQEASAEVPQPDLQIDDVNVEAEFEDDNIGMNEDGIPINGPFAEIGTMASISETEEKESDDEECPDEQAVEAKLQPKDTAPKDTGLVLPPIVVKARRKVGVSYSDLIKLQHGQNTKKLISLVDKMAKQGEQHEKNISEITEIHRQRHRLPDTRDNVYFKGGHGEVFTQETNSLMRTAAVIYPIKYGYSSQPQGGDFLPPISATEHNDSSHLSLWGNSRIDRPPRNGAPNTKSNRRSSRTNGYSGFSSCEREVKRRHSRNSTNMQLRRCDADTGITCPMASSRMVVSTSYKTYLTGIYSSASRKNTKLPSLDSLKVSSRGEATSGAWQSAFQKLKYVHSLSGDSDIF